MDDASLSVYGRRGKPDGIALVIARALPGTSVTRQGKIYCVTMALHRSLFRRVQPDMVVEVDPARFSGVNADQQRALLRHEVVRRIRGPGLDIALEMIPELQLAISFVPTETGRPIAHTDAIFQVVLDIAARVDGFVLDLGNGRLFSMTGQLWGSTELLLAEGGTPVDPSLKRIHARLITLVAVAARALTEYDGRDVQEARDGITDWARSLEVTSELEDVEESLLARPPGATAPEELTHWSWQIEGAVALAWALDFLDELPPFDEAVDPTLLSAVLRFPDAVKTQAVLRTGSRRHQAIIEAEAERYASLHWRLVEFAANPEPVDLDALTPNAGPGPLRFEGIPLLDGDLAVGGRPLQYADPDAVEVARSITFERLRALTWLCHGGSYSTSARRP